LTIKNSEEPKEVSEPSEIEEEEIKENSKENSKEKEEEIDPSTLDEEKARKIAVKKFNIKPSEVFID
jgi:hypothetical protein